MAVVGHALRVSRVAGLLLARGTHTLEGEGPMKHDELCWFVDPDKTPAVAVNDGWPCVCDLIARVAERERGRTYGWPDYLSQRDKDVRAAALRDAKAAVVEVHRKWGYPQQLIDSNVIVAAITALGKEQS